MKKIDTVKLISIGATVLGLAATVVSNWVSDKKLEETVAEKVNEALKNQK